MKIKKKLKSIELPAGEEHLKEALSFFRQSLDAEAISKEIVSETMLVIEALFHNLFAQGISRETTLRLSCRESLGTFLIRIGYEGKLATLYVEDEEGLSPENRILQTYEEKIDSSYRFGFNSFQIMVKREPLLSLLYCAVSIFCAFLAFLPIHFLLSRKAQMIVCKEILMPAEQLLGNAALMIGAPVTFFSLVKNLTDVYILSDRYSMIRKLWRGELISSLFTMLLAAGTAFLFFPPVLQLSVSVRAESAEEVSQILSELISGAIPPSIFEPFESMSPIPLILMSLIVTYVLCSAGKYFAILKQVVNICYSLFSRMLGLVLFTFPFFIFVMFLEQLILQDMATIRNLTQGVALILFSTVFMFAVLVVRVKLGGVSIRLFLQKLPPLLLENCRINSVIDAVPFNIRYCVRHYRMNRNLLERVLPAVAQITLDGNCFILMNVALFLAFRSGNEVRWYDILVFAFLVLFLSIGAPNQPGSILIGTMILLNYMGFEGPSYMFLAIVFEAAFGIIQNLINVIGDIGRAAVEDQKMKMNRGGEK